MLPLVEAKPFNIPKRVVWKAFKRAKANRGAAGVDKQSIAGFEADLSNNLYKLWNWMCSGSHFPPPVRRVEIPKADGGMRPLGIPTVADRIAQEVARRYLEPRLEPVFHTCKIWLRRTIRTSKAGSTTTATSIGRSCARPSRGSMSMSSAGRAGSTSGCVTRPKGHGIGLHGFVVQIQLCLLIGSYVMATAEHREPYELRGSRTVLGARGGEIPPRDSTKPEFTAPQQQWPVHLKKRTCLAHERQFVQETALSSCSFGVGRTQGSVRNRDRLGAGAGPLLSHPPSTG